MAGCSGRSSSDRNDNRTVSRLLTPIKRRQTLPTREIPSHSVLPWNNVPQEILVNVFHYLNDGDRGRAKLTCKAWLRISNLASLWRRRRFLFQSTNFKYRQVCYGAFFNHHGRHVHHVTLEFKWPDISCSYSHSHVAQSFETFVAEANKCTALRLLSIKARYLNFHFYWRIFSHYRTKVLQLLCSLLERQPMLQEVDLAFCYLNRDDGLRVLESLTGGLTTKRNLQRLDLQEFFDSRARAVGLKRFRDVMGGFPALSFLRLDQTVHSMTIYSWCWLSRHSRLMTATRRLPCTDEGDLLSVLALLCPQRYLCEAVLEKLIAGSSQTLRYLHIVVDTLHGPVVHVIRSDAWQLAVRRCASLTVTVHMIGMFTFEGYSSVLMTAMPLTTVSLHDMGTVIDLDSQELHFTDVARFLQHISDTFPNTIEEVRVDLRRDAQVVVDETVVKLIEKCLRLKRLILSLALKPETLDKLVSVLATRPQNG